MSEADPYAAAPAPAAQPTNGMAVASLVLGVLSILFVWIPFVGLISWVLAPVGLVLGLVALGKPTGRGLAIAGAICSGIGLLGCIGWVVLIGAVAAAGAGV
ncbi:MAG: hypothetical protein KF910_06915 [Brevundimonas sp.]|uniref:hypothetical protein n=1 Tax=Brevundimonas sp. TaxID=1871086 RepID=UPI0025C11AD6|nr:hypothetical protein [Brevundimonas sp.]MBX3477320.1 hypothetical protein [Brevundimonas sp.]